jgi:hypothetical protein
MTNLIGEHPPGVFPRFPDRHALSLAESLRPPEVDGPQAG